MPIALLALSLSAFVVGTTEFVIVGLIATIATDLNISIPSAGALVSIYALGVAIGAPFLTLLTRKIQRKFLILLILFIFTLGNFIAFLAPSYNILMLSRLITGLAHGVFFAIGSTIATSLVKKEKAASAIAIMFMGLTVSLVTAVPLGTWIGQKFNWQTTFLLVAILGFITLLLNLVLLPKKLQKPPKTTIKEQTKILLNKNLLLVYSITALGYGGNFIAFTFLAPMLAQVTGFIPSTIATLILIYGLSVAFGNVLGGKLADKLGAIKALYLLFSALILVLIALYFAINNKILTIIVLIFWGAFAFGNVPPLQVYVVDLAKKYTPNSVDLASGFNIAAFNIGIALGAFVGGIIVLNINLQATTIIGALFVFIALCLTYICAKLNKNELQSKD